MTNQLYITDEGNVDEQPMTHDGQPLYSPETVREGLFDTTAFEQMPGQMPIDNTPETVEKRRDMFRGFGWGVS